MAIVRSPDLIPIREAQIGGRIRTFFHLRASYWCECPMFSEGHLSTMPTTTTLILLTGRTVGADASDFQAAIAQTMLASVIAGSDSGSGQP